MEKNYNYYLKFKKDDKNNGLFKFNKFNLNNLNLSILKKKAFVTRVKYNLFLSNIDYFLFLQHFTYNFYIKSSTSF